MVPTTRMMTDYLSIPIRPAWTSPAEDAPPIATVLLVNDDGPIRRLTAKYLNLNGFSVLAAENGLQALTIWSTCRESIDLLLTDVELPESISGLDLAARLRAECPGMPVLFTNDFGADRTDQDGLISAGLHFLQKPYRPERLLTAVRAILAAAPRPVESVC